MRKLLILSAALALTACAGRLTLVSEGKAYYGTYSTMSKEISVDIEGVRYSGTYVLGQVNSSGFGSAFASNGASAFGNAFSTSTSNRGQAVLIGTNNQALRCQFMASDFDAQGQCQDSAGKMYDFIGKVGS